MKAAARITPGLRQALRPAVLPAGPSRLSTRTASTLTSEAPVSEAPTHPPNLAFENIAPRKRVDTSLKDRAQQLHQLPTNPFEPISHPLSSLSSPTPTLPSEGTIALPQEIFNKPLRKDILHRNVVWYLSQLRQGTQSTRSRATIAYSGRKLRPQKGSGKARVGDAGSGVRRGGAPIFNLSPRDWAQDLPRKVRDLGVRTALSAKLREGALRIVEDLNDQSWRGTNDAVRALADGEGGVRFGGKKDLNILFVHAPFREDALENFYLKVRNVEGIDMLPSDEVEAYHILKHKWVVLEADAVEAFAGAEVFVEDAEFEAEVEKALRAELELGGVEGIDGAEVQKMMQEVGQKA